MEWSGIEYRAEHSTAEQSGGVEWSGVARGVECCGVVWIDTSVGNMYIVISLDPAIHLPGAHEVSGWISRFYAVDPPPSVTWSLPGLL